MGQTNWSAIIYTSLTAIVGLVCAVIALTLSKEDATTKGLLLGIAGTALGTFFKQPHKAGNGNDKPSSGVVCLLVFVLATCFAMPARADGDHPEFPGKASDGDHPATGLGCVDTANTYCVVWNQAVAWQLNLKDFNPRQGAVLLGLSLQHRFGTFPMALGIYAGLGTSDTGKSYQACGGLSITNWGLVCIGTQRVSFDSGRTAWQGVLSFALQATAGSSP